MDAATRDTPRPPEVPRKRRLGRELVVELVFGPLADRLALALLPLRVPPPALVLANGVAGLAAALVLGQGALVAAALLLQLKTVLDNADGRLARVSGRVTLLGRYLDTELDLAVNVVLFAVLGRVAGEPWLALAAFCALTLVLSVNFNFAELTTEARGGRRPPPEPSGGRLEHALERIYAWVFGPQDRLIRAISERRLERILRAERDLARRTEATLAYYDRLAATLLANLGLSTQFVVLGACLAVGAPELYLCLVLASAVLPLPLQLRRERLARRVLSRPYDAAPLSVSR
jgi:archaetidylinositol phosphate synthase